MSGDGRFLSVPGEQHIRNAFVGADVLRASDLIDRLIRRDGGYGSRASACQLISTAFFAGLLVRTGSRSCYAYTLMPGWKRMATRQALFGNPRESSARRDVEPAAPYVGPAFAPAALAPSVGMVCGETQEEREGELPPWLGGQIVDSLQRGFHEVFGSVE